MDGTALLWKRVTFLLLNMLARVSTSLRLLVSLILPAILMMLDNVEAHKCTVEECTFFMKLFPGGCVLESSQCFCRVFGAWLTEMNCQGDYVDAIASAYSME